MMVFQKSCCITHMVFHMAQPLWLALNICEDI